MVPPHGVELLGLDPSLHRSRFESEKFWQGWTG